MSARPALAPVRIAIADDHPLMLEALREKLCAIPGCEVVLAAPDGQAFMEALPGVLPVHIAVLDMNVPKADGVVVMRWLKEEHPEVMALAFSFDVTDANILKAMGAGARGFLSKTADAHDLSTAVDHLCSTGYYRTHLVQDCLQRNPDGRTEEERARARAVKELTDRELEVISTICTTAELTNEGASVELGTCKRTVDSHCSNIYDKLKVKGRVGLALRAASLGLIPETIMEAWRQLGAKA